MTLDPEVRARLRLNRAAEPGDIRIARAVFEEGVPPAVLVERILARREPWMEPLAVRIETSDPEQDLRAGADVGARFLTPAHPEWPRGLDDLAHAGVVADRAGPPLGLWVRGPLRLDEAVRSAVAVVGSRAATSYGTEVATRLGSDLAREGWTVVSGAAFGIDQAAHRGALIAEGTTVAVLSCGPDRAYPVAHERLIEHIAVHGVVVTESPPGAGVTRIGFLARNRLIAALANGSVVVEAALRSGALNTATWSMAMGRAVLGVPGPVTSGVSAGVHQLIREGGVLVTPATEVVEQVSPMGRTTLWAPRERARAEDALTVVEQAVRDAVPARRRASTAEVARAAARGVDDVARILERLAWMGLIDGDEDGWTYLPSGPGPAG